MSIIKSNPLLIETEYFKQWKIRLNETEADLIYRERKAHEEYARNLNSLKHYKAKLRKFNYQLSFCEVIGLCRINRIAYHLKRKISEYNQYCDFQQLICESNTLDIAHLIAERTLLFKERIDYLKKESKYLLAFKVL